MRMSLRFSVLFHMRHGSSGRDNNACPCKTVNLLIIVTYGHKTHPQLVCLDIHSDPSEENHCNSYPGNFRQLSSVARFHYYFHPWSKHIGSNFVCEWMWRDCATLLKVENQDRPAWREANSLEETLIGRGCIQKSRNPPHNFGDLNFLLEKFSTSIWCVTKILETIYSERRWEV